MLHGPLLGKIVLFALPLAASSILQQLFNAADTAVVGNFASSQAMAAVGSTGSLINLIISLFVGLSVGANVVIASLIGQQKKTQINEAVHTAIMIALVGGFALIFVGIALARPLLELMGTPDDVIDLAVVYMRIYFIGMPVIMLFNFGSAILRSRGDSKRPLIALASAGVINVLLNLFFVIVFHLHVIGVALATVISNVISAGLVCWFLAHETGEFRLEWRKLRFHKAHLLQMLKIGIPSGIQGAVFALSNTVIQSAINSFGSYAVAGASAAANFEIIGYLGINSFSQAATTFTSQNYAAREKDRCDRIFRICMAAGILFAMLLDFSFYFSSGLVLRLFSQDPEVLAYAQIRFRHVLVFHWLVGTYEISGAAMRGMGYSMTPALISILGTCVFRLLFVLGIFPLVGTFEFLLDVYPISWVLTGIITLTAYFLVRKKAYSKI